MEESVIQFIRDVADNYDCDSDGHKYGTGCRSCEANAILRDMKISTHHQEMIDKGIISDFTGIPQ